MAVKFEHTFMYSTVTAIAAVALFYALSSGRMAVLEAYTINDTYLGSVFVLMLALLIGLAVWPKVLEKRQ
ncbi:MAG: hypothetical protein SCH39_10315 [Methanosarcinales archaeon]|nr:hypothetical protein [ANME-2 cluster archaeon]MDW7776710.1 hypothetical protein [Methanosarcinales archaeon]